MRIYLSGATALGQQPFHRNVDPARVKLVPCSAEWCDFPGGRAILKSNGPGRELPALQASPLGRPWGSDTSIPPGSDIRSPRPQGRAPHGAMGGYRTGLTSCAWKRHGGRRRGPTPQQSVFRRESSQGHFCRKPLHGQWNDPYSDQAASMTRPPPNTSLPLPPHRAPPDATSIGKEHSERYPLRTVSNVFPRWARIVGVVSHGVRSSPLPP